MGPSHLRIAIWDDGRIRFAEDQKKWSHALRQGRISADQIARLKEDILKTGVFDLKGYCYLVPDAGNGLSHARLQREEPDALLG